MKDTRFELLTTQRHLRLLFFVERGYDHPKLLDLFNYNQNLWGGRYNPIIPFEQTEPNKEWYSLISFFDPDYIYCTSKIDVEDVKSLCYSVGLNPLEIRVLEDDLRNIEGLHASHLYSSLNYHLSGIRLIGPHSMASPLKEYYRLNYLIEDKSPLPYATVGKYGVMTLSKDSFDKIHYYITKDRLEGFRRMSQLNLNVDILRPKEYSHDSFEIIIAKDTNAFDDFIYFWNRTLYRNNLYLPDQLIITIDQLQLLLADEYFGEFIDHQYKRELGIVEISSLSVTTEDLEKIKVQLEALTKGCCYRIKSIDNFPFEVLDAGAQNPRPNGEQLFVDAGYNEGHLFHIPQLSFSNSSLGQNEQWVLDIVTRINDSRDVIKYPFTRRPEFGLSRINGSNDISVVLKSDVSRLVVSVPNAFDVIRQVIQSPRLINEKDLMIYEIGYNDSSRKLSGFLNLFENEFHSFESLFYDKFWADFFYSLSSNTKVEGDCFTLEDLLYQCLEKMNASNFDLGKKGETFKNEENLKLGLIDTLQELCDGKILRPGYILKCKHCSSKGWYSIDEISTQVECKGCSNLNFFKAETPISYKLNSLIKNNIAGVDKDGAIIPDGNLTVIKTLNFLSTKKYHHFSYLPQLDIYEIGQTEKPISDLDVVCIVNGKLHIGECKYDSELFKANSSKALNNLLIIAEKVRPEVLVLGCTEDKHNRLENAKSYLETRMQSWKWKPEVVIYKTWVPDHYQFDDHSYWKY